MDSLGVRNLLTVEEAGVRPRANSDPTVNAGGLLLPEIRVEDCTDPDLFHHLPSTTLPFGKDDPPRPRANTCPEDLFRKRNGRPPTPPPGTFRKGHKFRSGFGKAVMKKESVSFAHHRLSKLAESEDADDHHRIPGTKDVDDPHLSSPSEGEEDEAERLHCGLNNLHLESEHICIRDRYPQASTYTEESNCCPSRCGGLGNSRGSAAENSSSHSSCVSDAPEDSFVCQSQPGKCRCGQTSASAVDSKQLQAC